MENKRKFTFRTFRSILLYGGICFYAIVASINSINFNRAKQVNSLSIEFILNANDEVLYNLDPHLLNLKVHAKSFLSDMKKFKQDKYIKDFKDTQIFTTKNYLIKENPIAASIQDGLFVAFFQSYFNHSFQSQKKIFYHEFGHSVYYYAHSHEGIMSYKNTRVNDQSLNHFFNQKKQNKLEIFDSMGTYSQLLLNKKILNKPYNSTYKDTKEFFNINSNIIEDIFTKIIIYFFILKDLVYFFRRQREKTYEPAVAI